jgi:HlyD family secretion protein
MPILAIGALVFAVWSVLHLREMRQPVAPPEPPPMAESATASGPVAGVGLLQANTENIELSVPVPGWVTEVYAHAGDQVEMGQPLFRLDDRDLQAELRVRRVALAAARAHVLTAEAELADAELLRVDAVQLDRGKVISMEESKRKIIAADAARARLVEARAAVALAEAQEGQTEVNIARMTTTAPVAGQILQSDVRPGQYAPSGPLAKPLMLLGNIEPLHVRVDVDEQDASRVRAGAPASASPRGDALHRLRLAFVRFEPYVLPKKSLTGDSTERTDTRVLQAIYRVEPPAHGAAQPPDTFPSLFVGQQVDVFIDSRASASVAATH